MQPGDIVTQINGSDIKSANDVYSILTDTKSQELKMTIIRDRRMIQVAVVPEDIN